MVARSPAMSWLLVGSRAWSPHRPPADWDFIAPYDQVDEIRRLVARICRVIYGNGPAARPPMVVPMSESKTKLLTGGQHVEVEIAWEGSTGAELLAIHEANRSRTYGNFCGVTVGSATMDMVYTLKMSHRFLKNSPHFKKTMDDIRWMRTQGAKIFDEAWLKRREAETYWYDHPDLNTTKSDFFKPGGDVKYIFDHDSIHEAVAVDGRPAYLAYKGDGEVMCSRRKFEALPLELRLRGVLEEAYVLALERSQITHGDLYAGIMDHPAYDLIRPNRSTPVWERPRPEWSFKTALEKVCTSITSGWFREFAWEHYEDVLSMYDPDYAYKFWMKVHAREVKMAS